MSNVEEDSRQERKRRKKTSGWDVQTPVDEHEDISTLLTQSVKAQQDARIQAQATSIFHTTQATTEISNRIYVG